MAAGVKMFEFRLTEEGKRAYAAAYLAERQRLDVEASQKRYADNICRELEIKRSVLEGEIVRIERETASNMSAEVIPLKLDMVGEGAKVPPDSVLEGAKGRLTHVVVIGLDENGFLQLFGSDGAAQTNFLLDRAKAHLIFNHET